MPLFIPWWALLSSGCAPVLLISGWALAATLQPEGYDPMVQSISSLAAQGAVDPWLMAGALFIVGVCHLVTAFGLRAAASPGRVALGCGGVAAVLVALFPEPADGGVSLRHVTSAGVGFAALAIWPVLAAAHRSSAARTTWALRPLTGYAVTALMMTIAAWFLLELHDHGAAGLAERVLTGTQSLWPLIVVGACLGSRRKARVRAPTSTASASTCLPMRQHP